MIAILPEFSTRSVRRFRNSGNVSALGL
jgi:hypothetical protein